MERKYYTINEEMARHAKSMNSFSEYRHGSLTEEYQSMCNDTYDLAEKAIEMRPKEEERISRLADRFARRLADNFNKDSAISCMCPSILVSGAGNFPVRKKEKQIRAWDKNHKDYEEVMAIRDKIDSIARGKDIIKSNDDDAIERLEAKIAILEAEQEKMREANKAIRMKDVEKGNARLRELGFEDGNIMHLRTPDFLGRLGFPLYMLSNNNAMIRNTKLRLEELKKAKAMETTETEYDFCKVVENTEAMRIQLFFDGKPDANVRDILKSHGFRWAPSFGAWQRQLNGNGKHATRIVLEKLKEVMA